MLAAVGLPVEELHRRRYGPLGDKGLEAGGFRELTAMRSRRCAAPAKMCGAVGEEDEGQPSLADAAGSPGRAVRCDDGGASPTRAARA